MKKIIIIGSSVAGCSAANFLAGNCDVTVYEQKKREEVGKKLCSDIVTPVFFRYAELLGLNPNKHVISKLGKAIAVSGNQISEFKTDEFKISRMSFIEDLIAKSQEKGVKFEFGEGFKDFREENGGFIVELNNKTDKCDILIGADGAMSKVAKKAGLWKDRKLFLAIQSEVPSKKLNINKDSYYVYVGKEKFGYYSYIFPSKNKTIIGIMDDPKTAKDRYNKFTEMLKIKNVEKDAALIPYPQIIPQRKNLFVIGDAGCQIKFSGGGIIPSMMSAEAIAEIIIKKDDKKLKSLNRRILMHKLATKIILKLKDEDFNEFIKILKDKKFQGLLEKRDEYSMKDYLAFLDLRLLKYIFKIF